MKNLPVGKYVWVGTGILARVAQVKRVTKKGQYTVTLLPEPECEAMYFKREDLEPVGNSNVAKAAIHQWKKSKVERQ